MTIVVLSTVEIRVARLAAAGYSDPEVAQALDVTRDTVVRHLSRIRRKLGARSRTEMIAMLDDVAGMGQIDGSAS